MMGGCTYKADLNNLAENYRALPDTKVDVKGVINIKTFSDFVVHTTYRDIFLVINMLDDYAGLLQQNPDNNGYTEYMIKQFLRISDELAEQIGLDKEKMCQKCKKKQDDDAVGKDAFVLAMGK